MFLHARNFSPKKGRQRYFKKTFAGWPMGHGFLHFFRGSGDEQTVPNLGGWESSSEPSSSILVGLQDVNSPILWAVKLVEKIESFLKPFRHIRRFPETRTSEFFQFCKWIFLEYGKLVSFWVLNSLFSGENLLLLNFTSRGPYRRREQSWSSLLCRWNSSQQQGKPFMQRSFFVVRDFFSRRLESDL